VVEGAVTFVDAASRRERLKYQDPKSGAAIELSGEVPPDRTIMINGEPATLADVRVGDHGRAKGQLTLGPRAPGAKREKRIIARWVQMCRPERGALQHIKGSPGPAAPAWGREDAGMSSRRSAAPCQSVVTFLILVWAVLGTAIWGRQP